MIGDAPIAREQGYGRGLEGLVAGDTAIAEIDGVDGACLSAFSGAEVTIRRANLTQCGGEGAVVRARSGARVYIDDDTALPDLSDLIRFDARDAEILMR